MSASHQQEAALFDAVIELPPAAREAYLDRACEGDPALRQRVNALLNAADHSCSHLDVPPNQAPTVLGPGEIPPSEGPGDRIGRYKLLQQIGEGGCGVVYMAEQEEPVRRRVALKVIKLGLDTKSVIARFEAERQALALMDHPNIAKVLDAGSTVTGRPYFVMELVRGMKITDYCDEARLSPQSRLDLFIHVCAAIQHAHQKGIIHRDIKPSNVLVTVNDGVAVPKVIDFGIAKATSGQRLTDRTVFTAFEQFIGTPAYMSPEQAALTSVDIDTRSDIYGLGVLLYELLAGRTPFDAQDLLAVGLDEMRRTIREREPARPSTRLSSLPGIELDTTAHRRSIEAPKLVSQLRGDLDWIVMKCLEKDRARRYETANGLASDIRRYLQSEPVVARPPSLLYRLGKTARRNRLVFAAGTMVVVSLVLGLTFTTLSLRRELVARHRADQQAAVAQAVNSFLTDDLLRQATPMLQVQAGFAPDPGLTVREALERAAGRIDERFREQPVPEMAVRLAIGEALLEVGEEARAIRHLERARDIARTHFAPEAIETVRVLNALARALLRAEKSEEARSVAEDAWKRGKAALGPSAEETLRAQTTVGIASWRTQQFERAASLLEEVASHRQAHFPPGDRETLRVMTLWSRALGDVNQAERGLRLANETVRLCRSTLGTNDPQTATATDGLAGLLRKVGRLRDALPQYEAAERLYASTLGADHPNTLVMLSARADTLSLLGEHELALPLFEETVRRLRERRGEIHSQTLLALMNTASGFHRAGRHDRAAAFLEEAIRRWEQAAGPTHFMTMAAMNNLGLAYEFSGNLEKAIPVFEQALERRRVTLGPTNRYTLTTALCVARTRILTGRVDSGLLLLDEMLAIPNADWAANLRYDAALQYREGKQFARAEALFHEVIAQLRSPTNRPTDLPSSWLGVALSELARSLALRGDAAGARPYLEEAVELFRTHPDWPADDRRIASFVLEFAARQSGDADWIRSMRRERLEMLRAAAQAGDAIAMNDLAWRLATDPEPLLRDGPEAVRWAEKVLAQRGTNDWSALDTLAAAQAEAGDFERAVAHQERSASLAPNEKVRADLIARRKLFEARTPFREP